MYACVCMYACVHVSVCVCMCSCVHTCIHILSSVYLLAVGCLGLRPCFAGLCALMPLVIKAFVAFMSAVFETRGNVTAITSFSMFLD